MTIWILPFFDLSQTCYKHRHATNTDVCRCEHEQPSFFLTETRLMMGSYGDSTFNHLTTTRCEFFQSDWCELKYLKRNHLYLWTKTSWKKFLCLQRMMDRCVVFNKSQSFDFTKKDSGRRCWGVSLLVQSQRKHPADLPPPPASQKPLLFPTISNQSPPYPSSPLPLTLHGLFLQSYVRFLSTGCLLRLLAYADFILPRLQYSSRKLLD